MQEIVNRLMAHIISRNKISITLAYNAMVKELNLQRDIKGMVVDIYAGIIEYPHIL